MTRIRPRALAAALLSAAAFTLVTHTATLDALTACSVTLTGPSSVISGASAAAATVTASSSSCTWTASSNVAWITIVNASGTGSGPAYLIFAANGGGLRSGTITLDSGANITINQAANPNPPKTLDFTGPLSLPDNATSTVTFAITGLSAPISDVTVSLYLTHPNDADLDILLVGPDGTTVTLTAGRGGTGDNYGSACSPPGSRTTFSDAAATSIAQGSAPFVGSYRPDQPLGAFRGKIGSAANGGWTVIVDDTAAGNTGTLECLSLNVFTQVPTVVPADFDGDASADVALYRSNGDWAVRRSSTGFTSSFVKSWGGAGYTAVPGDYDGDGIQDLGLYRESTGDWLVLTSSTNFTASLSVNLGGPGYKPEPGDYDGDGRTDPAVYNAVTGVWSVLKSSTSYGGALTIGWGGPGYTPLPGMDFDGDGISDIGIYSAATGAWSILKSSTNFTTTISVGWGGPGYMLVPGDYDLDRRADLGLYDPVSGDWHILLSGTGYTTIRTISWGGIGYVPVAADFDADGKIDAGLFQPGTGNWYVLKSTTSYTASIDITGWGAAGDRPLSGAIVPAASDTTRATDRDADGRADITVFNSGTGVWSALQSSGSYATAQSVSLGGSTYTPVAGDFDGDGKADVVVYHPVTGDWYVLLSSTGFTTSLTKNAGGVGWAPVPADYDGDGRTDFAVYNATMGLWFRSEEHTS